MRERKLTFGGEVIPAKIASAPHIIRPVRKMVITQIAGTNREMIEMEDAWEAYDQPYTLYVGDGTEDSIQEALNAVALTLYKTGYQKLIDDYEPNYFRMAYFQGPFDVENRRTFLGKFDISFRCRPERFLISGSTPVEIASSEALVNPTAFTAKPLIHVEGSGDGSITIAGRTLEIEDMIDYLNIDCDTMNVYRLQSENRNSLVSGEFPLIQAGINSVSFTGGITAVTITPRFWVI